MATVASLVKQAVYDKFESQIKTAETDLDVLRARARVAKANVELKAITEYTGLLASRILIRCKLGIQNVRQRSYAYEGTSGRGQKASRESGTILAC